MVPCGRQRNRSNVIAETVSEYYKRSNSIPIIDYVNSELKRRFDHQNMVPYFGLCIIPSVLLSYKNDPLKENLKQIYHEFSSFYSDDFPNMLALSAELDQWEIYILGNIQSWLPTK